MKKNKKKWSRIIHSQLLEGRCAETAMPCCSLVCLFFCMWLPFFFYSYQPSLHHHYHYHHIHCHFLSIIWDRQLLTTTTTEIITTVPRLVSFLLKLHSFLSSFLPVPQNTYISNRDETFWEFPVFRTLPNDITSGLEPV